MGREVIKQWSSLRFFSAGVSIGSKMFFSDPRKQGHDKSLPPVKPDNLKVTDEPKDFYTTDKVNNKMNNENKPWKVWNNVHRKMLIRPQ